MKGTLMDIACSSHHATEAGYTESHDKKCPLAVDLIKKTDHDKDWKVLVIGSGCCTSPPPRLAML